MACCVRGGSLGLREAFEKCINPGACGAEAGLQGVTLVRKDIDLFGKQCVGALELFVTQKQSLDALCNLVDLGRVGHVRICTTATIVG